jgi:hypothetical protein
MCIKSALCITNVLVFLTKLSQFELNLEIIVEIQLTIEQFNLFAEYLTNVKTLIIHTFDVENYNTKLSHFEKKNATIKPNNLLTENYLMILSNNCHKMTTLVVFGSIPRNSLLILIVSFQSLQYLNISNAYGYHKSLFNQINPFYISTNLNEIYFGTELQISYLFNILKALKGRVPTLNITYLQRNTEVKVDLKLTKEDEFHNDVYNKGSITCIVC